MHKMGRLYYTNRGFDLPLWESVTNQILEQSAFFTIFDADEANNLI